MFFECQIHIWPGNISRFRSSKLKMASLNLVTRVFKPLSINLAHANKVRHAFAFTRCMSTGKKYK